MQNNVNSNISWYEGHTITSLGKILKFSKFYVQNIWQVVRWWHHQVTHLHIHIDWSRNCFVKICEISKCHNFLIFQPIFIRFFIMEFFFKMIIDDSDLDSCPPPPLLKTDYAINGCNKVTDKYVTNIKRNRSFQTCKCKNCASELAQIEFLEVDVLSLAYESFTLPCSTQATCNK